MFTTVKNLKVQLPTKVRTAHAYAIALNSINSFVGRFVNLNSDYKLHSIRAELMSILTTVRSLQHLLAESR